MLVTQTGTLIVGCSISGLALAACFKKHDISYTIIEKEAQVAWPWRNHYQRLHLHTNRRTSNLPYKKFDRKIPRYPTRQQVINYLEDYQRTFNIQPVFNTEATSIRRENDDWITETNHKTFRSKYLVMATGVFGNPAPVCFPGMETFPKSIIHSCQYKTGSDFRGQKVLVVGFGNSACEIAIDLYEQGALPSMSVRSPVNIVPRDLAGIPILELSQLMSRFPPRIADAIIAPVMRLIFGDITKLGLKKMSYGPFREIRKDNKTPVLDIGTIQLIRKGHIKVHGDIHRIEGSTVYFSDGTKNDVDMIVACIGYNKANAEIITVDKSRFEDLNVSIDKQKYFGKDGLYFCGFWIGPRGQIHEIARDAKKIAKDIASKESRF